MDSKTQDQPWTRQECSGRGCVRQTRGSELAEAPQRRLPAVFACRAVCIKASLPARCSSNTGKDDAPISQGRPSYHAKHMLCVVMCVTRQPEDGQLIIMTVSSAAFALKVEMFETMVSLLMGRLHHERDEFRMKLFGFTNFC